MTLNTLLEILEGTGLVLAFLDFTGWSRSLGAWIDRQRYRIFQWLAGEGHTKIADHYGKIVSLPAMALFVVVMYGLATGADYALMLYGWWLLLVMVPLLILGVLLPLGYNLLLLMNKPPSGTVGTISLAIALASFCLQRTEAARTLVGMLTGTAVS